MLKRIASVSAGQILAWVFRVGGRFVVLGLAAVTLSGCAIIVDRGAEARDYYVIGYARIRLPNTSADGANARVVEITGVGLAISDFFQLGYFKEFQASVKPETNSAVVVVRSDAEIKRLEALLRELNQTGLCLIIKDQRS